MTTELRVRNQAQQLYVRALSAAYRVSTQVFVPSVWLIKDPEAEEKMRRNADIGHALSLRQSMVAGRQWNLTPRVKNHERSAMALHVGQELMDSIPKFTHARRMLALAFFSGSRFARIHGEHRKLKIGDGKTRVWFVPTRIQDMDWRRFRIKVDQDGRIPGEQPKAHWQFWDVFGNGDFEPLTKEDAHQIIRHTYEDDESTLGYGRALREQLGFWWYTIEHVINESMMAAEKHGGGILRAKVEGARDAETGLPNSEVIRAWVATLEDLRGRHVLVHDAADEVDVIQPSGTGWAMFKELREEARNTITKLILGAHMNTNATKGGSHALAEVHEDTTESLIQYDREALEETITDDLLKDCLWYRNAANLRELGIENHCPRFAITQEKIHDPQIRVQVAATASQMGLPIAKSDLYEQLGFRPPEDGEETVESPQQPQPSPLGGGGFGFRADRGDGAPVIPRRPNGRFAPRVKAPKGQGSLFGQWDESKHPRDGGKFAPHEGAGQDPDENRTNSSSAAESKGAIALQELPAEALAYLDGKVGLEPQEHTPEEKADADRGLAALGEALTGGSIGSAFAGMIQKTPNEAVKLVTEPGRLLKVAVGLGILAPATVWNALKVYGGLAITIAKTAGSTASKVFGFRPEAAPGGEKKSLRDRVAAFGEQVAADVKQRPLSGSLDAIGSVLIALPAPFTGDAGLIIKGVSKVGQAFNPARTERSIKDAIRQAFMRALFGSDWDESKHPRADDGKFGPGSGKGESSSESKPADHRATRSLVALDDKIESLTGDHGEAISGALNDQLQAHDRDLRSVEREHRAGIGQMMADGEEASAELLGSAFDEADEFELNSFELKSEKEAGKMLKDLAALDDDIDNRIAQLSGMISEVEGFAANDVAWPDEDTYRGSLSEAASGSTEALESKRRDIESEIGRYGDSDEGKANAASVDALMDKAWEAQSEFSKMSEDADQTLQSEIRDREKRVQRKLVDHAEDELAPWRHRLEKLGIAKRKIANARENARAYLGVEQ